jgi:NADPH-dependent 2,4-dienoyl-CoA reductase/sulfur reductase-like enzyme
MTCMNSSATVDLLIVGGGPAGIAAALEGTSLGLSVLLADENPRLGGQVYRSLGASPLEGRKILGRDYHSGAALLDEAEKAGFEYLTGASVWMIERNKDGGFSAGISRQSSTSFVTSQSVLIATGALERPFPIPGWTLPGVMTAGAAQSFLKASGIAPEGPLVLAGMGPLLYLLAAQYARAKVQIDAVLDTTPRDNWRRALRYLPGFLSSSYAWKGLRLLIETGRSTRLIAGVTGLRAIGDHELKEVAFVVAGRERRIEARTLLLHQGVVPQVNLAMAAGCEYRWNDARLAFEPILSNWGETTQPGLFIAGDSSGIGGAKAAEAFGRLAARGVALHLGHVTEKQAEALAYRRQAARALAGRAFLDALYRPPMSFRVPADDVIVCRCEEVTAGAVRAVTARGAPGPNQAKTFLRAGMGPCQGRLCGLTVTEIMAEATGRSPSQIGHYRLRNPVKPVTLGELAGHTVSPSL